MKSINIENSNIENRKELIDCGEWTSAIFGSKSECEDFIWSYLYDNGKQHDLPESMSDGTFLLTHEV